MGSENPNFDRPAIHFICGAVRVGYEDWVAWCIDSDTTSVVCVLKEESSNILKHASAIIESNSQTLTAVEIVQLYIRGMPIIDIGAMQYSGIP